MIIQADAQTVLGLDRRAPIDLPVCGIGFQQVGPPADASLAVVLDRLVVSVRIQDRQIDQLILVIIFIHHPSQSDLPHVAETLGLFGLFFCGAQGRHQQAGENGNDGDDDQELDQREGRRLLADR